MKVEYLVLIFLMVLGCRPSFEEPQISLEAYHIEPGFDLEVVASEPLLKAPVAIDFDTKGRLWVADMPGFMNNLEGKGEDDPTGSIRILEDKDQDGVMDHAKIFLDSLVLPRALALVYGGLLYVEPPKLWFVEIDDDRPGHRTLVDSLYAADGNPEHQPNGLMLNIDNWIYNAKSHFRYQRKDGKWLKEPTTFRGQWGISHDDFGRLYYNDNSRQLLGDYVLPNRFTRNTYYTPKYGVNQLLTKDQRVYPLQPTLVNRGYAKGVLDKDSLLVNVTAACGPLVYRGGTFPEGYGQNAFVCVPEANLIKRNIVTFYDDSTAAKQAWYDKEFLAATDEGFRPVNLSNGPDGALYVVDMHRGIIGHHAYLSPYLKEKAEAKQLDTMVSSGRILKITNQKSTLFENMDLEHMDAAQLVALLKHKNGWIRDHAQHELIYRDLKEAVSQLQSLARDTEDPIHQIHALYTLKGLDTLSVALLIEIAEKGFPQVTAHTLVLLEDFVSEHDALAAKNLFSDLILRNDPFIDLYLSSTLGTWVQVHTDYFAPFVYAMANKYKDDPIFDEALISGMATNMQEFLPSGGSPYHFKNDDFVVQLEKSMALQKEQKPNRIFSNKVLAEDTRTKGAKMFRQICAACHGINGEGSDGLAPPLMNSEYVTKPVERLGLIILHGLAGPVNVNGTTYEINQPMPGLLHNESLSDNDMADIISYVTNAFSGAPGQLKPEKIRELRKLKPKNGNEYTEEELSEYAKKLP